MLILHRLLLKGMVSPFLNLLFQKWWPFYPNQFWNVTHCAAGHAENGREPHRERRAAFSSSHLSDIKAITIFQTHPNLSVILFITQPQGNMIQHERYSSWHKSLLQSRELCMNPGWEMGMMDPYGNTIAGTAPRSLTKAPGDVSDWLRMLWAPGPKPALQDSCPSVTAQQGFSSGCVQLM